MKTRPVPKKKGKTIIVVVSGGCVQSVTKGKDQKVIIRDYDCEPVDLESGFNIKKDRSGDYYQEMIF